VERYSNNSACHQPCAVSGTDETKDLLRFFDLVGEEWDFFELRWVRGLSSKDTLSGLFVRSEQFRMFSSQASAINWVKLFYPNTSSLETLMTSINQTHCPYKLKDVGIRGKGIQVRFCSANMAALITPDQKMACISITNPGDPDALLLPGWGNLLRISFGNITYSEACIEYFERMWSLIGEKAFVKKHALEIRQFLDSLDETTSTLIVHCDEGISRSSAVAIFASLKFGVMLDGEPFNEVSAKYNTTVLSLLQNPCRFDSVLKAEPEKKHEFRVTGVRDLFSRFNNCLRGIFAITTKMESRHENV
jgi:predicted protein tyrosine phosphatase